MSALVIDIGGLAAPSFRDRRPAARPVRATPGAAARSAGLRLTRRGRVLVAALALAGALVASFASQQAVAGEAPDAVPVATRTVAAGETLWQIASQIAGPGEDVRDVVSTLMDLNGLASGALMAGQELLVPAP